MLFLCAFLLPAVLVVNAFYVRSLADGLPERVATHFGFDGRPDRWMSRQGFVRFATYFPIGLALLMVGLGFGSRYLDPNSLHVAHAAYWRSPDHYIEACNRLMGALCIFACGITVFVAFVWRVTAQAQSKDPVRIDVKSLIGAVLPFGVFMACWCIWLSRMYDLPK